MPMEDQEHKTIKKEEVKTRKKETSDFKTADNNHRNAGVILAIAIMVLSLLVMSWSLWQLSKEKQLRKNAEQQLAALRQELGLAPEPGAVILTEGRAETAAVKKGDSVIAIIKRQLDGLECLDALAGRTNDDKAFVLAKKAGYIRDDGSEIRLATSAIGKLAIRVECAEGKIVIKEYQLDKGAVPIKTIALGDGQKNELNIFEYAYFPQPDYGFAALEAADQGPDLVLKVEVSCQADAPDETGFLWEGRRYAYDG